MSFETFRSPPLGSRSDANAHRARAESSAPEAQCQPGTGREYARAEQKLHLGVRDLPSPNNSRQRGSACEVFDVRAALAAGPMRISCRGRSARTRESRRGSGYLYAPRYDPPGTRPGQARKRAGEDAHGRVQTLASDTARFV
jgi:hypothetical protein